MRKDGKNACDGKREAAKAHEDQRRRFCRRMDVILDDDLQPKRCVIKEGDQNSTIMSVASGVFSQAIKAV